MIGLSRRDCLTSLIAICASLAAPPFAHATGRVAARPSARICGVTMIDNLPWWDASGHCDLCAVPDRPALAIALNGRSCGDGILHG